MFRCVSRITGLQLQRKRHTGFFRGKNFHVATIDGNVKRDRGDFRRGPSVALQTGPIFSHRSLSRRIYPRASNPALSKSSGGPGKTTNSDALASDFYLSRPMRIDRHELMRHYCAAVSRPAQKTASFGVDPLVTIAPKLFTGSLATLHCAWINSNDSNFWSPPFFFFDFSFFFARKLIFELVGWFVYKI